MGSRYGRRKSLSKAAGGEIPCQKHVSVKESGGEYFQVSFDNEDPRGDDLDLSPPDQPYLLVQRQFEDDDGGVCYIETLDHDTTPATTACGSLSSHPHASPSRSSGRTTNTSKSLST